MNIYLKNISKRFGRVEAVKELSLCFGSGKLTALLGPSGCGKTTLLNIISGVLAPSSGDVYFGETPMTGVPLSRRNIGYVFQNYSLYPNMTAYDNLKFPLTNQKMPGLSRAERREFYDEQIQSIARLLRIEATLPRYPSELSGGQQQRVALGRAIIRQPDILLMDEPFANLDRKLSVQMREEVRQIQQQTGITTVFVTHNQADANAISDRIVLMNEGTVQQEDDAAGIYDRPANLFAADFFGEYGSNILSREELDGSGLAISPGEGAAYVSFRPEDLAVTGREGPFLVRSGTRVGGSRLYTLENGGVRLTLLTTEILSPGDHVAVAADPDRVCRYGPAGRRLDRSGVQP